MFLVGLGVAVVGYFAGRLDREALAVIRWGLCCQFLDAPIKFRTATHRYVATLDPAARRAYLAEIAAHNAAALADSRPALPVARHRRVPDQQPGPSARHPSRQRLHPGAARPDGAIAGRFLEAGALARAYDVRLSFHPDQFVVLNSEREAVVKSSLGSSSSRRRSRS